MGMFITSRETVYRRLRAFHLDSAVSLKRPREKIGSVRRTSSFCISYSQSPKWLKNLNKLISKRQWKDVISFLEGMPETERSDFASGTYFVDEFKSNVLHKTCRSRPPWHVICALLQVNPNLASQVDHAGQTPLHVASSCGASSLVVAFLLEHDPETALSLDNKGRTPLRLLVECLSAETNQIKRRSTSIIEHLARGAPMCVNLEDKDGISALEYAIVHEAHLTVVQAIQKASVAEWQLLKCKNKQFSCTWGGSVGDTISCSSVGEDF